LYRARALYAFCFPLAFRSFPLLIRLFLLTDHGLLSMAAYGDDPTTACAQTFTQAALLASFPDSTEQPWTYIQGWGPTASGASGFAVVIPGA
jgi:hypothetical protein